MNKSVYKVCAIGVICGISGFLPISITLKWIIIVGVFIAFILVNTDDEKDD